MEIHLKFIGIFLLLLSLMHIGFPRYFKWKKELASVSLMNRQMMYVHSFFIALTVLMMAILCLFYTDELIHNPFGKVIAAGFGIFWMIRFFFQLFGYSSKLWRGKIFETTIHIVFSICWLYISWIFLSIGFHS